jgi:hypothetical protein
MDGLVARGQLQRLPGWSLTREQGHWPTVANVGYRNDLKTKRIEVDPEMLYVRLQRISDTVVCTGILQPLSIQVRKRGRRQFRASPSLNAFSLVSGLDYSPKVAKRFFKVRTRSQSLRRLAG